jgi:hypothetical protein
VLTTRIIVLTASIIVLTTSIIVLILPKVNHTVGFKVVETPRLSGNATKFALENLSRLLPTGPVDF